jgi:hypothetical protein
VTTVGVYVIVRLVSQELAKEVVYAISVAAAAATLVAAVAAPDGAAPQANSKATKNVTP